MLIVASHVNSEPILICVIYYFVVNNLENTQLAHAMRNNIMVEVNKFAKLLRNIIVILCYIYLPGHYL